MAPINFNRNVFMLLIVVVLLSCNITVIAPAIAPAIAPTGPLFIILAVGYILATADSDTLMMIFFAFLFSTRFRGLYYGFVRHQYSNNRRYNYRRGH